MTLPEQKESVAKKTNKNTNFYEKLLELISLFSVPKEKKNTFADFNFRDAESIMKAVKPPALALGLYINVTKEVVKIDDRFYVKAIATVTDGVCKEQSVSFAREPMIKPKMDESQVTGSASSYAKKYALQDLLMIDDGKDDPDRSNKNQANSQSVHTQKKALLINGKQLAEIRQEANKITEITNISPDNFLNKICELFKVNTIDQLTANSFNQAKSQLVKWKQSYTEKLNKQNEEQTQLFDDRKINNVGNEHQKNEIKWGQR